MSYTHNNVDVGWPFYLEKTKYTTVKLVAHQLHYIGRLSKLDPLLKPFDTLPMACCWVVALWPNIFQLIWAFSSANWQHSASLMLAFGILAQQIKAFLREQFNQRALGLIMISLGLYTLTIWP